MVTERKSRIIAQARGFTLIELLVVIAVIAMLLSILMPALKKAKDLGRRIICSTRMKDIGTALSVYSMNNRDAIPSSTRSLNEMNEGKDAREAFWLRRLAPYYDKLKGSGPGDLEEFAGFELLRCPTQEKWRKHVIDLAAQGRMQESIQHRDSMYYTVYAMNTFFVLEKENRSVANYVAEFTYRYYNEISTPGTLPLITEHNGDIPSDYQGQTTNIVMPTGILFPFYGPHPVANQFGWKNEIEGGGPTYLRGPAPNHNGATNYLMGDMHVETKTKIWPWNKEFLGRDAVAPDFHPKRATRKLRQ